MKRCILLRHGEVDNPKKIFYGRSLNIPLNDVGVKQIQIAAEKLAKLPLKITSIYASPLLRTIQTAKIIGKKLNLVINKEVDFMDVNIPALVGKPISIRKELHTQGKDEYEGTWVTKGHEKRSDIQKRVLSAFQKILEKDKTGIPLIISHGDPLICLLYSLFNPDKRLPKIGELKKLGYIISKGSAIILEFNKLGKAIKKNNL